MSVQENRVSVRYCKPVIKKAQNNQRNNHGMQQHRLSPYGITEALNPQSNPGFYPYQRNAGQAKKIVVKPQKKAHEASA